MSKNDPDFFKRMCRIDGMKPTARDRWKAIHRLWRLACGRDPECDLAAEDCFRVLISDWRWIHLLGEGGAKTGGPVNRSIYPTALRKRLLDMDRRRRLYGNRQVEWQARDKAVAHKLREEGREVLPSEVAEVRRKVINIAKRVAAENDCPLPDDDEEILEIIRPRKGEDVE